MVKPVKPGNVWSSAPCLYKDPTSGKQCYTSVGYYRSYCEEHQTPAWFNPYREKPTQKFIRNRPTVIRRAQGRCEMIFPENGERCTNTGEDVDHIEPLSEGGTDDLFNLRLLCKSCHKVKTQAEANRARNDRFKGVKR